MAIRTHRHPIGSHPPDRTNDADHGEREPQLRASQPQLSLNAGRILDSFPTTPPDWPRRNAETPGRSRQDLPDAVSRSNSLPGYANNSYHSIAPTLLEKLQLELFIKWRSRVLLLHNPWLSATDADTKQCVKKLRPTIWQVRETGSLACVNDSSSDRHLWMVFQTHEEACVALRTSSPTLILTPATEQDLEATQNLHQVSWSELEDMSTFAVSAEPARRSATSPWDNGASSDPRYNTICVPAVATRDTILGHELYHLSSNPPNPKLSFRAGDWWCPLAHCAAHNFGRNVCCIKCGTPKGTNGPQPGSGINPVQTSPPPQISPRFMNQHNPLDDVARMLESRSPHLHASRKQVPDKAAHSVNSSSSIGIGSKPPLPHYPILTPSGSALSVGGRVRNVSDDPLSPCVMYWPDNEPLPEPGQIRPFGSVVIQFPPIINTGNKGAAEKQPGDWICQKCKYLNWRRRKVCQTCFPYAEGNGDSISAAVQAERIALLAGVLNRAETPTIAQSHPTAPPNVYSREPPRVYQESNQLPYRVIPRQESPPKIQQIYRTPDNIPYLPSSRAREMYQAPDSCGLLPSFLHDIVQSPALSPASSTSSSDTGLEDAFATFDISDRFGGTRLRRHPYSASSSSSVSSSSISSIWKLDGEESKSLGLGSVSPIEKFPTAFPSFA